MTDARTCPECGASLAADAANSPCPTCLMKLGLESWEARSNMDPTADSPQGRDSSHAFIPPEPDELADRFPQLDILELIGHGGMGAVYKARQKNLDRLVALKIIKPEAADNAAFAERFAREARALAKLNHPHIVVVHDFGQADTLYYFVMEYVDGTNLRQLIRGGELVPEQALAIIPQICESLQFAHDEGIVHRDIKPENILVDTKGRVKIADFGLAKLLGTHQPDEVLTGTHQIMGTPRYMAPEQMEGSRAVDHRADIYSLGVVFYEMLTGELPIGRFDPPSRKVQVDVRLDEVVLKTLEQEPDRRYQQASEVRFDVENVSRGDQHTASHPRESDAVEHDASDSVIDDWLPIFRLLAMAVSCIVALTVMMPWTRVEIEALAQGHRIRAGEMIEFDVYGYSHVLPIVISIMASVLAVCIMFTVSSRALIWRATLTIGTALMIMVAALSIFSTSPLTDHPDHYKSAVVRITGAMPDVGRTPLSQLRQLQRDTIVELRAERDNGPIVMLFLAIPLLFFGAMELQATSLWHGNSNNADHLDDAMRTVGNGLMLTGLISGVGLVVVALASISYSTLMGYGPPQDHYAKLLAIALAAHLVHMLVVVPVLIIGGKRMKVYRSRRLVICASVLATLPFSLSFVVGLPIGILALRVMKRAGVVSGCV